MPAFTPGLWGGGGCVSGLKRAFSRFIGAISPLLRPLSSSGRYISGRIGAVSIDIRGIPQGTGDVSIETKETCTDIAAISIQIREI